MAYQTKDEWKKLVLKQRIALHVSTIRKSKGMSVAELAEASGYEPSMIRKIENANILPAKGKDKELADALDISLDQLWGRKKFRKFWEDGQPVLNESERTAFTLYAPILKALSVERRLMLMDYALTQLAAQGVVPEWERHEPESK